MVINIHRNYLISNSNYWIYNIYYHKVYLIYVSVLFVDTIGMIIAYWFPIDWHNFVVVETVDYQPWEVGNFPPPTNPQEVGARVLMQRRIESAPAPVASSQKAKVDENREG